MTTTAFGSARFASERPAIPLVRHAKFVPACLALGLVLRLGAAWLLPFEPSSDAAWYVARALGLLAGEGYTEDGVPTAYWPVGWPAILAGATALTGSIEVSVVSLNLAAAAFTLFAVLWFGRQVAGSELVGRLALLGYAVYPNHIAYTGQATTEIVYTALALAALMLLVAGRHRPWRLAVAGAVFGIAALVKPQTLAFPAGAVIALAWVYRDVGLGAGLRAGLIVYVTMFAVVLPWSARNHAVFGEFVLVSTNGGTALILGANDQMTGAHFDYQHTDAFRQLGIPWDERVERQVELNARQKTVAKAWIREHPAEWLAWMPKKVALLWMKDTDGFWAFDRAFPERTGLVRTAQVLNQAFYAFILVTALVCALRALVALVTPGYDARALGLLFLMPVFVSLICAVFTGQIRYHFPAMPLLLVAAAWTCAWAFDRVRGDGAPMSPGDVVR